MPPEPSAPSIVLSSPVATLADRARPHMRLLGLLALGHMVVDVNQGSLPALLPFLKSGLALSYTGTAFIVLTANVTSSLVQPLFGYFADRTARRWLLPLSVMFSSIGLGLTGLAPSYALVLVLVLVAGLGIAAYHPEGYRTATAVAGDRKVTGVSIFSTGGNVGIALGPPLIAALVTGFGLPGTLGMLLPGLVVSTLLAAVLPMLSTPAPARTRSATSAPRTMVKAMSVLILVVAARSWTQLGFTTYVPFYYLEVLKGDPRMVGTLLAVFLGAGAVGTLIAGPIADRVGVRLYVVGVFLLATPLAVAFLLAPNALAMVFLGALGFVLVSSFTASVVLGQAYMPRNPGMASGLIVGFAIGAGGLGVTALGWAADRWGLMASLWISAMIPLLGFVLALFLPEPRAR